MSIAREIKIALAEALLDAAREAAAAGHLGTLGPEDIEPSAKGWAIEKPKDKAHGDFASNIALVLAGAARQSPRRVAETLLKYLRDDRLREAGSRQLPSYAGECGSLLKNAEVAGPGFINFFVDHRWLNWALAEAVREGRDFGRSDAGRGIKVQVEFVSANPTGPIVVVQGRAGAIGDALANLLSACGYDVEREFYVNDAGRQVDLLAESLEARVRELVGLEGRIPEGGYPGEYLLDLARDLLREKGETVLDAAGLHEFLREYAVSSIRTWHERTLRRYGINFDVWFSEKSLHSSGAVAEAVSILESRGYAYRSDGALWLRTSSFGDEKDRVLVKSDGEPTYFAPDIAYHLNKLRRGFHRIIDIWGPDHHGYIPRMKAALRALGYPEDILRVLIVQLVRLVRGGKPVRMGKRKGEFVTLDELLDEVGVDAARFFFLARAPSSQLDFDVDLAKAQSEENPVYYVQYAHARIMSIFRQAEGRFSLPAEGVRGAAPAQPSCRRDPAAEDASPASCRLDLLVEEPELDLMRRIAQFPEEVLDSAESLEPHRITRYLLDLASSFHVFYTRCRVLGEDPELSVARLYLVEGARVALANGLRLLGISAPERM